MMKEKQKKKKGNASSQSVKNEGNRNASAIKKGKENVFQAQQLHSLAQMICPHATQYKPLPYSLSK